MKRVTLKRKLILLIGALLVVCSFVGLMSITTLRVFVADAQARFAGAARLDGARLGGYVGHYRPVGTVRRYYRPGHVRHPAALGYAAGRRAGVDAAVATGAVLNVLPSNCEPEDDNGLVYKCGDVTYRPDYQGTQVQYVPAN